MERGSCVIVSIHACMYLLIYELHHTILSERRYEMTTAQMELSALEDLELNFDADAFVVENAQPDVEAQAQYPR